MVTRLVTRQDILRVLRHQDDMVLPASSVTTAAGSTTTLLDTLLGRGGGAGNTNLYDNRLVELQENLVAAFGTVATVNGVHTAATTTLAVNNATSIVISRYIEVNGSERMLVTAKSANNLTVVRGQLGTTAAALSGGETVQAVLLGEVAGVNDAGFDGTSSLTVSPAFSATVPSNMDYALYPQGYSPEECIDAIREALRMTEVPTIWLPSLVDDANFDANDVTQWAAVDTPTTRAFTTTAANALLGERSLHVITNAVDEGAASNRVLVTEQEQLLLWAAVQSISGDCQVVLYNNTASSDVYSVTIDQEAFTEVLFQRAVPDNCEAVRVRFLSDATAASEFYVSAGVVLQSLWRRHYAVPSWLTRPEQVKGSRYMPQGWTSEAGDSYAAFSSEWESGPDLNWQREMRGLNPLRVEFKGRMLAPVALLCARPPVDLTDDTTDSPVDREYLKCKALSLIFRDHGEGALHGYWRDEANKIARALGYNEQRKSIRHARYTYV